MTSFATLVPPVHALWPVAGKKLGAEMNWEARNGLQRLLVSKKSQALALAETLAPDELLGVASNVCEEVNRVLREKGFPSVQLTDQGSIKMLYVASVFKILGNFLFPGQTDFHLSKIKKPAFRLSKDAQVKHFEYAGGRVVAVPTDNNFSLLVTNPTGATGFDMLADWEDILRRIVGKEIKANGVVLPMAMVDETDIDVSGLVGMSSSGPDWTISQAKMAAKFSLTPVSVKFEAAFSAAMRKGFSTGNEPEPGDYVADHPLYFALVRKGHFLPLAAGLVDPADLSNIDVR